jgi:hypothetical protein
MVHMVMRVTADLIGATDTGRTDTGATTEIVPSGLPEPPVLIVQRDCFAWLSAGLCSKASMLDIRTAG